MRPKSTFVMYQCKALGHSYRIFKRVSSGLPLYYVQVFIGCHWKPLLDVCRSYQDALYALALHVHRDILCTGSLTPLS